MNRDGPYTQRSVGSGRFDPVLRLKDLLAPLSKLLRYAAVSIVCTSVSVLALAVLVGVLAAPATWANFGVVGAMILPAFELSRRWVWPSHGSGWPWNQIVPFGVLSLSALALSTLAVHYAAVATAHSPRSTRTLAVEAATLSAFAVLWLVQYIVNDRVLFRRIEP